MEVALVTKLALGATSTRQLQPWAAPPGVGRVAPAAADVETCVCVCASPAVLQSLRRACGSGWRAWKQRMWRTR